NLADRLSRRSNLLIFVGAELAIMLFGAASKWLFYDFFYRYHPELGQSGVLLWTILFFSLLWPTFFMGASLPFLARALTAEIRAAAPTIGRLYGVNTLGAGAGALLTSWVLLPNLGLAHSLYVGIALNAACAGTLLLVLVVIRQSLIEVRGNAGEPQSTELS